MAFREGERNVGLRLTADLIEASPDLYFALLKEGSNERPSTPDPDAGGDTSDDPAGFADPYA